MHSALGESRSVQLPAQCTVPFVMPHPSCPFRQVRQSLAAVEISATNLNCPVQVCASVRKSVQVATPLATLSTRLGRQGQSHCCLAWTLLLLSPATLFLLCWYFTFTLKLVHCACPDNNLDSATLVVRRA